MTGVFLGRPLFISMRLPDQEITTGAANNFFQPRRRASQTRAQVRMLLGWKRKVKLPFKPNRWSIHEGWRFKYLLLQDAMEGGRDTIRATLPARPNLLCNGRIYKTEITGH
jgi:hypothetical protein